MGESLTLIIDAIRNALFFVLNKSSPSWFNIFIVIAFFSIPILFGFIQDAVTDGLQLSEQQKNAIKQLSTYIVYINFPLIPVLIFIL